MLSDLKDWYIIIMHVKFEINNMRRLDIVFIIGMYIVILLGGGTALSISLSSCSSDIKNQHEVTTNSLSILKPSKTIYLPKGQRLVNVSWSGVTDIWYLTETMPSSYLPNEKFFFHVGGDHYYLFVESRDDNNSR